MQWLQPRVVTSMSSAWCAMPVGCVLDEYYSLKSSVHTQCWQLILAVGTNRISLRRCRRLGYPIGWPGTEEVDCKQRVQV